MRFSQDRICNISHVEGRTPNPIFHMRDKSTYCTEEVMYASRTTCNIPIYRSDSRFARENTLQSNFTSGGD